MARFQVLNPNTGLIEPVVLREGQFDIAEAIVFKKSKRVIVICPTQYGKSFTVGLSIIICCSLLGEEFIIVAPKDDQARIIMDVILTHLFDDAIFFARLTMEDKEKVSKLQKLQEQHTKKSLKWSNGGSVRIISAQESRTSNFGAVMGQGAPNVIIDESALISNDRYGSIKRMIGAFKDMGFLFEIGNPFELDPHHFYRTWEYATNYRKIHIGVDQALREGAFTQSFLDEMREDIGEQMYRVYYEALFPNQNLIDENGYYRLLTADDIKYEPKTTVKHKGKLRLGIDVGGGGDKTTFVLRSDTRADVVARNQSIDTMVNVSEFERILGLYPELDPRNVTIDIVGLGRGLHDRLIEKGYPVVAGIAGGTAQKKKRYYNKKAEWAMAAQKSVKGGLVITDEVLYKQIQWYKFKEHSDKVTRLEPKSDLKKRTGKSPDEGDAFLMTYNESTTVQTSAEKLPGM